MELHVEIDSSCVGIAPRITKRPPPLKMSTDMVTGQRWRSGGQLKVNALRCCLLFLVWQPHHGGKAGFFPSLD